MKLDKNLNLNIGPTKEFLARQQRALGGSLKDISKEFDIPVTSLRRLCSDIKLINEQRKKLLSKRKKKTIEIDYESGGIIIKGRIKIRVLKKQLFNDEKLIKDIIEICLSEIK